MQRSDGSTCKNDLLCPLHCPTQHIRRVTIHKVPSSLHSTVTVFLFYPYRIFLPYSINFLATPVFWSTLTWLLVDLMFSPIPSKHPNNRNVSFSQFTQISFTFLCIPLMFLYLISHPTACSQLHTSAVLNITFLLFPTSCFTVITIQFKCPWLAPQHFILDINFPQT